MILSRYLVALTVVTVLVGCERRMSDPGVVQMKGAARLSDVRSVVADCRASGFLLGHQVEKRKCALMWTDSEGRVAQSFQADGVVWRAVGTHSAFIVVNRTAGTISWVSLGTDGAVRQQLFAASSEIGSLSLVVAMPDKALVGFVGVPTSSKGRESRLWIASINSLETVETLELPLKVASGTSQDGRFVLLSDTWEDGGGLVEVAHTDDVGWQVQEQKWRAMPKNLSSMATVIGVTDPLTPIIMDGTESEFDTLWIGQDLVPLPSPWRIGGKAIESGGRIYVELQSGIASIESGTNRVQIIQRRLGEQPMSLQTCCCQNAALLLHGGDVRLLVPVSK